MLLLDDLIGIFQHEPLRIPLQLGHMLLEMLAVTLEPRVEVHVQRRRRPEARSDSRSGVLRDQPQIAQRTLEGDTKLLELRTRPLQAIQGDEESQNLVGPFEDPIDARVTEQPLVRIRLHIAASSRDQSDLRRDQRDSATLHLLEWPG